MTQVVRALIVTDGSGGFHTTAAVGGGAHFHLGEFVSILQGTAWEGFTLAITKAHRGRGNDGVSPPVTAADVNADLIDFDFAAHDLTAYDMILIFAIMPDGTQMIRTGNALVSADATPAELAAITAFMQAGGGVFATGDHESLGAGLCREIPRVRNMRRWYFGNAPVGVPEAPNGGDETRLDTLRSGFDATYQFDDQSDTIPQEIIPAMHYSRWGRYLRVGYPHPLLCSPLGIVRHLPDHPHEGRCEVPAHLDQITLGAEEYPVAAGGARLAPEVVADATVIGGHSTGTKPPVNEARFGVIGAWDGHRVDRGRVVVDATWHHFFNINLTGQVGAPANKDQGFYGPRPMGQPDLYPSIQWYFRNIVYWLVPKGRVVYTLREAILVAAHSGPSFEEFPHWREGGYRGPFDWHFVWDVAQITKAYFDRVRGGCYWLQVIDIILYPLPHWKKWWEELAPLFDPWFPKPGKTPRPRPWMDPRLAADAAIVLDAIIGAHTLATLEAAGRVGVKGREKLHAEADALLDKYLHASLAEAAKALAAARREMSPMHKALAGLKQ
jgi:hypothetical protein